MDIVGGAFLADGTEAKIATGVDDHSRYCVTCHVAPRATGRAVCLAFAAALRKLEAMVRSRLRTIQRRPELINALLGQTGLTLDPQPP